MTERDPYLITIIDKYINSFGDKLTFSILGSSCGYWQVEIIDADCKKTAFTSHHWIYQLYCLSLGLGNGPETFQRIMDVSLSPVKRQLVFYISMESSSFQELSKSTSSIFEPKCLCCKEQASHWTWKVNVLYRDHWLIDMRNTPCSIGTYFLYLGCNSRLDLTTNSNGTEIVFVFMQCIPTLHYQLRTDICHTQC